MRRALHPERAWALVAAALTLLSTPALAERPTRPLSGEPPTAGVHLDVPSLTSDLDPSGVELNPAAVGLLPSWALLYRHTELRREGRIDGGGDALLFGTPLPYLRLLALGVGLQWVRPADAIGYEDSVKLSFALALRYKQVLALGLGYHVFICDHDAALDGLQSLDLGLALRPLEWLGAGLVVRNLNTPVYDGLPLQRIYDLELTGRPLATDRLELGAGLRLGERRGEVDPYFRVEVEPLRGLRLFAGVELVRRDFYRDGDQMLDVRSTVGLGLNLERIGLAFSTILGRELEARSGGGLGTDARSTFQGAGVTLRFQGERRVPLFHTQGKLLVLELTNELSQRTWTKMVTDLHELEGRDDVQGVLLEIDNLECGWGQVQEIRRWLRRLRKKGKRSYAYLRAPGTREYYLAAAADEVLLDPGGDIQLKGLAMQMLFFRALFDKVGVAPQFVRIAEFKSAPESFTRETATPEARKVREEQLDDLYHQLLHDLAADRKTTPVKMRKIIDEGPYTPPQAMKAKLVDRLVGPDELEATVERLSGANLIKPSKLGQRPPRWPVGPSVAVVLVEGDIVRGKSVSIPILGRRLVGDQTIGEALAWARSQSAVKAVVLRVNSSGGSAMASDAMWREVSRTRKTKPVVVSFGDVAASGGYYAAASGERIYAEPATLTGSIGIFTGKFDLSGLLQKIGIGVDTHSRGKRALLESFNRPYTEEERAFVLARLQHHYRAFLRAVAKGRKMTEKEVDKVARGRVWTGRQALARGLVDASGGLIDAIEEAKRRAGLPLDRPTRVVVLPKVKKSLLGQLLSLAGRGQSDELLPADVRRALEAIPPVLLRARSGEPLARMPYELQLR